jgi:fructokinase
LETTSPDETLRKIRTELEGFEARHDRYSGLGLGTFGPVQLDPDAADLGCIGQTPKSSWINCDLHGCFAEWVTVPICLDTDVNAAAFGELVWGAAKSCRSVVYITVGTGIGVGVLINGETVHDLLHPEAGHMRVPRAPDDRFAGMCPYHGDCVDGMAAGCAIVKRWCKKRAQLKSGHPAYAQTAHYLSHLVTSAVLLISPDKIIMGGVVTSNPVMIRLIRSKVQALLNRYIAVPGIESDIDGYIVQPALGSNAGVLGAIAMALSRQS